MPKIKATTANKIRNKQFSSGKQVCRKTQAAQASLKVWGWKDNKIYLITAETTKPV